MDTIRFCIMCGSPVNAEKERFCRKCGFEIRGKPKQAPEEERPPAAAEDEFSREEFVAKLQEGMPEGVSVELSDDGVLTMYVPEKEQAPASADVDSGQEPQEPVFTKEQEEEAAAILRAIIPEGAPPATTDGGMAVMAAPRPPVKFDHIPSTADGDTEAEVDIRKAGAAPPEAEEEDWAPVQVRELLEGFETGELAEPGVDYNRASFVPTGWAVNHEGQAQIRVPCAEGVAVFTAMRGEMGTNVLYHGKRGEGEIVHQNISRIGRDGNTLCFFDGVTEPDDGHNPENFVMFRIRPEGDGAPSLGGADADAAVGLLMDGFGSGAFDGWTIDDEYGAPMASIPCD
ncbi:MAG: hypothetical protein FWH47_05300, partial [Methanomassiliicoccaceae archaeon]|nr:hypothetical protein [Methanomassiliicoccaceae archaeon]